CAPAILAQRASSVQPMRGEKIVPSAQISKLRRDQRAFCFAARADGRPCLPPRPRPFRFANRTLVTSLPGAGRRSSGGLPSAARRRALRSGFVPLGAPLRSPLHFPRSPTADRSQNPNQLRIEV